MPVPGELLGDRYRLDDRIAAGGMGEVWRATDTVLGRDVAVKTLRAGRAGDPGFEVRFRHEARAMAALHHSGIANVYDFGETGDHADAYIVMEHVDGTPLNALIAERGRLTPQETMSIVAQAAHALQAAHQAGIVHRDVKPGNMIIQPDGTVVLVDFGVARSAESAALTGAKEVVGTALYIAPEQVSKDETGPAADVYALGGVAYHCLAGHPPFAGENPIAVAMQHLQDEPPPLPADIPVPVRNLVARALAKNPADRFPSASAMAEAAEQVSSADDTATALMTAPVVPAGPPVAEFSEAVASPGPPPRPRHRLAVAAAVLLVLGVAAAVLAFANPGGLLPGSGADPTPTPSTAVSGPPPAGGTGSADEPAQGAEPSQNTGTTKAPAGTQPRPSASPSRSASSSPSNSPSESSSPSPSASASPSASSDDDEGGGDNDGGTSGGGTSGGGNSGGGNTGGDGNSGPGGGNGSGGGGGDTVGTGDESGGGTGGGTESGIGSDSGSDTGSDSGDVSSASASVDD